MSERPTKPLITVFTPTFNRASVLPRVFQSLTAQTLQDFEWLVIDDGSADNTAELVQGWTTEAMFPIRYQWQPNQGKHIAYNAAALAAKGDFLICADSDDQLLPEALETLMNRWNQLDAVSRAHAAGLMFMCKNQHGELVGDKFPLDAQVADLMEMFMVRKIGGEKGSMFLTKLVKQHPFPASVKNVYVPESVFLQVISESWKMLCVNDALRIYWMDERTDHLGSQINTLKNLPGDRFSTLAFLNHGARLAFRVPRLFLANAAYYSRASFFLKITTAKQWTEIKGLKGKLAWMLTLPVGYLMYKKIKS